MPDHIREYWNAQGATHGASHVASWGDTHAIELEIDTIGEHIQAGQDVLDVGCANGYATFRQLEKGVASIAGVDFAPNMIDAALKRKREEGFGDEVDFSVADIRELPFDGGRFDVVYTTRVLINLPTWKEQLVGIEECIRVCRPGGTVVFSEGFWEPLVRLNAMRALVDLPPLVEHDFNRYLKKARLEAYLRDSGLEFEVDDFSSIYYLGSRFLRELVTDADAYPGYSNPINALFREIERDYSGGGLGIQQAYVVRKGCEGA